MVSILIDLTKIASYAFIGGSIKLLDQVLDQRNYFQKQHVGYWLITLALILLVNVWTCFDVFTAILTVALILGLISTRKVDNLYFVLLAITTFPLSIFTILRTDFLLLLLPTLLVILPTVVLDEVLHAAATNISNRLVAWVLTHRPILKITVLMLPFFGLLTFVHTIAFWCFDISYDLVAYYYRASSSAERMARSGHHANTR